MNYRTSLLFATYLLLVAPATAQLTPAIQWQKSLGGSLTDRASSIAPTSDGGYIVAGVTTSNNGDVTNFHGEVDYWVVKLDATGTIQWQKTLGGGGDDRANSIAPTSDGGYIVAGYTGSDDGDVTNFHGDFDYWVVKLDATGTIQWQKTLGGGGGDRANSIAPTSDGGYIVAGETSSNNGDVTNFHGGWDYWVVKLDATGTIQWQKTLGGSSSDYANSIVPTSDGGCIVAGYTRSNDGDVTNNHGIFTDDYWVVKLDATGTMQWQKTLGGSDYDNAHSIAPTSDGGYIVAGYSQSDDGDVTNFHGGWDYWVVKLTNDFNTISGQVFGDLNSNALLDNGEPLLEHHQIHVVGGAEHAWSGTDGTYWLQVLDSGSFVVEPSPLQHFTATPATHSASFNGFQQTALLNDFAFQPVGVVNDLTVSIAPTTAFRPGFDAGYVLAYANVGNTSLVPTIVMYTDPMISYVSASVAPNAITPDSIVWVLPVLTPFAEGTIHVVVNVDQATELGSYVSSPARITPLVGDAVPSDNNAIWTVLVTGSFDPNDKQVDRTTLEPNELLAPPVLNYLIRFQNTGIDTAFTVRIEDSLPAELLLNTLELVSTSHPVQLTHNSINDKLTFQFSNILLPDINTNEAASHGYVHFRIKPVNTLQLGDSILNQAAIYFDYNEPVITNTAYTVIEESTAIEVAAAPQGFSISPNPAKGSLVVRTTEAQRGATLTFIDALGRTVISESMISTTHTLAVGELPRGVYLVKLQSGAVKEAQRVVLE